MRVLPSVCCLAAALALPAAGRAEVITPDTIARPAPGNVGSANGTPVASPADLVSNQYAGAGLVFPPQVGSFPGINPTVVITGIGGANVWAPALTSEAVAGRVAVVDYRTTITGQLLHPTSSLSVEVVGPFGETLSAYDSHGHLLGFARLTGPTGPHGGTVLTIGGADISTFTVTGPLLMDGGAPGCIGPPPAPAPWGIAEVQTASAHAPEPATWLLAGLGALGAGAFSARRQLRRAGRGNRAGMDRSASLPL